MAAWPYLHAAYDGGASAALTDGQLLERFALRDGEPSALAFAALVERHGPLVLRACRASLGDLHDAEDAFQAVFLILARKARSLRVVDSIAPWLLDVARRTSAEARVIRARRRSREATVVGLPEPASPATDPDDPSPLVREELARLPDRYRAPLLLCDLEGLTQEEAARRLGWPIGTLKSRQSRGRSRLRARLIRRGLAPSATLGVLSTVGRASATVPARLAASTVSAALGGASPAAVSLMEGVVKAMLFRRLMVLASLVLLLGVAGGVGLARLDVPTGEGPPKPAPTPRRATARPIREILREAARSVRSDTTAPQRTYDLSEIAMAQVRAGDPDGAKETARAAVEAAERLPAGKALDALVRAAYACEATGDRAAGLLSLETAQRRAGGMERAGGDDLALLRSFGDRQSLLSAQLDLGHREAAVANVRAMAAAVEILKGDESRYFATAMTLVGAQTCVGDYEEAFRTARSVGEAHAQNKHHGKHHMTGFLLARIAMTLSPANRSAMEPGGILTPKERQARLPILNRIEKEVEAFEFAADKHLGELAQAYAYLGDFDSAIRLSRRFGKAPMEECFSLSVIGGLLGEAGRPEEARTMLREAIALSGGDPMLADWLSGQVAFAQAKAGDLPGALKRAEAVDLGQRVPILSGIAALQKKAGDREGARATLRIALGAAEDLLKNPPPPPANGGPGASLVRVAGAEARDADPERARQDNCRVRIAEIQALSGDHAAAVVTMGAISSERDKGRAAGAIARARADDGDAEGALTWALTLATPTVRGDAIRGLAEGVANPR